MNYSAYSQVGINNTQPKALLDITASDVSNPVFTDGILIPRVDNFPASITMTADQNGALLFFNGNPTTQKGFYFWDHANLKWTRAGNDSINSLTDGKSDSDGTDDGSSIFLGINAGEADDTTNNKNIGIGFDALKSNSDGSLNTALGHSALKANSSGNSNVAIGSQALLSNTTGVNNVALGNDALKENITGAGNTGLGVSALNNNTTGTSNTAVGYLSMNNNGSATSNTAVGNLSLYSNFNGNFNTAVGAQALISSTTARGNTALGANALAGNNPGNYNIAIGLEALELAGSGSENIAIGRQSHRNHSGSNDIAIGNFAMANVALNSTGEFNVAIGNSALNLLQTGTKNTSVGGLSGNNITTGNNNTVLGHEALSSNQTGSNNVAIGYQSAVNLKGSSNVFIGTQAGSGYTNLNNKLVINSNSFSFSNNPLISGDFTSKKVGININPSTELVHALNVRGNTYTTGDFITTTNTYPDYVFEKYFNGTSEIAPQYHQLTLEETIAFVKENNHLPGVKSFKEIEKAKMNVSLADVSITNLEKIEEHFLYIAELNSALKDSNAQIKNLKEENELLKTNLTTILKQQKAIELRLQKLENQ